MKNNLLWSTVHISRKGVVYDYYLFRKEIDKHCEALHVDSAALGSEASVEQITNATFVYLHPWGFM